MKLLAFSGKIAAGKDTCANFLIRTFYELFHIEQNNGERYHIRKYPISQTLKDIAVDVFGLDKTKVFGSHEDKLSLTQYTWSSLPHYLNCFIKQSGGDENYQHILPERQLTIREFLEEFGTGIMRKFDPDIHIKLCLKKIKSENCHVAVITDCREVNEVQRIQEFGGRVIRLTRNPQDKKHSIETALDPNVFDYGKFDAVIENDKQTVDETLRELIQILNNWGWISKKQ